MKRTANNWTSVILLATIAAVFVAATTWLFIVRFESGDVYPPYSTFRSDPLGARACYEALDLLDNVEVERNLKFLGEQKRDEIAAYFFLGLDSYLFYHADLSAVQELEFMASNGGRVVISFPPIIRNVRSTPPWKDPPMANPPATPPSKKGSAKDKLEDSSTTSTLTASSSSTATLAATSDPSEPYYEKYITSLAERWGVEFSLATVPTNKLRKIGDTVARRSDSAPIELPDELLWHTSLVFDPQVDDWNVIYSRGEKPVVVERRWGKGSIVLISDSFYFSNESVWVKRRPELIAWAIGQQDRIVFDETHHGIIESRGVMILARRYRLDGALIALILLAVLFIWRNNSSLVPPAESSSDGEKHAALARDASTGLVQLSRRHIKRNKLLTVCFDLWRQSISSKSAIQRDKVALMESVIVLEKDKPVKEQDPVTAYREVCRILKDRSNKSDSKT